jgi:hypothetical protein
MTDKKTIVSSTLGLLSGGATTLLGTCATACVAGGAATCAIPVLSIFGVSSSALANLSWLKYLLIPLSILLFGIAFYRLYRKPKTQACEPGSVACDCKPASTKNMKLTLWISFFISLGLMGWTFSKDSKAPVNQTCLSTSSCDAASQCDTGTFTSVSDTTAPVTKAPAKKPVMKNKPLKTATCKADCTQPCEKKIPASSCDTTTKVPACSKSTPCDNPCKKN